MIEALAGAVGAALYWVRGRGWPWGTTVNRLIWSVPTGLMIGLVSSAPLYMVPICVLACFLALVATGHSAHMGAYHTTPVPGDGEWTETATHGWLPKLVDRTKHLSIYNGIGLVAIGLMRISIMLAPVVAWEPYSAYALLLAPIHALAYFLGWYIYDKTGKSEPLVWSEILWGAAQWATLVFILEM